MGIFKALRFYRSLSQEQKDFVREKKIEDTQTVGQWLRFLTRAAAYDEYGDEGRKKIKPVLIILWLLFIVSIVLLFILPEGLTIFNIIIEVVLVILLIVYHIAFSKLKNRDLTNQLRLLFVPFLKLLLHKAGEKAKLSAKLEFSDFTKEKPESSSKNGTRSIDLYQPTFIIGKLRLLDKSLMEFVIGDDHRKLTIKKTSSSGKTKTKIKYKITHQALLKISFPKTNYVLSDSPGAAVIVEQDNYIIVKRKLKVKSDEEDSILKLEDFLALIDELYKAVKIKPGTKLPVTELDTAKKDDLKSGEEMEYDDDEFESGVTFMVWGSYFSESDYMGFEGDQGGYYMEEEGSDSFFDS